MVNEPSLVLSGLIYYGPLPPNLGKGWAEGFQAQAHSLRASREAKMGWLCYLDDPDQSHEQCVESPL